MKQKKGNTPKRPRAIALCGLAPEGNLKDAQASVGRLAGKAYHALVRRELGLETSYQLEERFSPPGTFHGANGRPHWWDALERDGVPNLLGNRRTAKYDRVAEVAKVTEVPGELLQWRLWRLLDPTPMTSFGLYSSLHTDAKHFKTDSRYGQLAEPFDLDVMAAELFDPDLVYARVFRTFFTLRRAEHCGNGREYGRALELWYRLLWSLRQDPIFQNWLPDLEQHVDRWLRRTRALIRYPSADTQVIETVLYEFDKEREEVIPRILRSPDMRSRRGPARRRTGQKRLKVTASAGLI